jgi:tetrahydrodipicolinate N-succinyltransferase
MTGKTRYVRSEDALQFLQDAILAGPGPKRQALLEAAMMAVYVGLLNTRKFNVRDDRRGRPKGIRHNDAAALRLMEKIARDTGIEKPHALARMAVESGKVALGGASADSVVRRLADRWRRRLIS